MKAKDLILLYQYNQWANERVFRVAERVTSEKFIVPANLSYDTLVGALLHILDVPWSWRLGCQTGVIPEEALSLKQLPDLQAMRDFNQEETRQVIRYLEGLSDEDLEKEVQYRYGDQDETHTRKLWHILFHAANHGTQHRGEVSQYLASCGAPPGDMDFLDFVSG